MTTKTLYLLGYEVEPTDVVMQVFSSADTWLDYVALRDQGDCDLSVAKVKELPNEFRLVWFSGQLIGPDSSKRNNWARNGDVVIPRKQFLAELEN